MKPPIAVLSPAEKKQLAEEIYYLNTAELRDVCEAHGIPHFIHAEKSPGKVVRTRDADRKGIVIDRILHFLNAGAVTPETIFCHQVVNFTPLGRPPMESDRVLYGQYRNHHPDTLALMKALTGGKFEFGAIAQEVLRARWAHGEAPTYREFANLWQRAAIEHKTPNPEWAFLTDRSRGAAGSGWKAMRNRKAASALSLLRKACLRLPP